MKFLLPYEENNEIQMKEYTPSFVRKELGKKYSHPSYCEGRIYQSYCEGRIYQYGNVSWYHTFSPPSSFPTKEDAMNDMDKYFIEHGYTILTQEQADKLMPLL